MERGNALKVILFPPVPLAICLTPPLVCEESDVIPTLVSQRQGSVFSYVSMRHMPASDACMYNNKLSTSTLLTHSLSFSVLARSAAFHLFTSYPYLKVPGKWSDLINGIEEREGETDRD